MYDNRRFYKGEDIRFFVTIRDNDGQLENITENYQDVIIYFYNKDIPGKSIVKASMRPTPGFTPIVRAYDSAKGDFVYECVIDSKLTEHMPAGQYIVETNVARKQPDEFKEQEISMAGYKNSFGVIDLTDASIIFNKEDNTFSATNILIMSTTQGPSNPAEAEYWCDIEGKFNNLNGEFDGTLSGVKLDADSPYGDGKIKGRFLINEDNETCAIKARGEWFTNTTGADGSDGDDNVDRSGKKLFYIDSTVGYVLMDNDKKMYVNMSKDAPLTGKMKTGVEYHKINNIGRALAFKLSDSMIKRESDIFPNELPGDMHSTDPIHKHGPHHLEPGVYVDDDYRRFGHHMAGHHCINPSYGDLNDDDRGYYRY